jgi:hypothetical protein
MRAFFTWQHGLPDSVFPLACASSTDRASAGAAEDIADTPNAMRIADSEHFIVMVMAKS